MSCTAVGAGREGAAASGRDAEGWSVHAVGLGCGRAGAGTAADSGSVKRLRPEVAAGCRSGRARCRYAAVGPGEFWGRTRGWIQEEVVVAGQGVEFVEGNQRKKARRVIKVLLDTLK